MDEREHAAQLVNHLAEALKRKSLFLNDADRATLEYGNIPFSISYLREHKCLLVRARICQIDLQLANDEVMEKLLSANHAHNESGSGIIGLDASTNTLYLTERIDLPLREQENGSSLLTLLARMAPVARWAANLLAQNPASQTGAASYSNANAPA